MLDSAGQMSAFLSCFNNGEWSRREEVSYVFIVVPCHKDIPSVLSNF